MTTKVESKRKIKESLFSETGKFLIDVAKLVFGGVIITAIMQNEYIDQLTLIYYGTIAMLFSFAAGLILTSISLKLSNKEK